ncbi:MAG: tetratricopeptide repeat protein [Byssovorax sp.]
MSIDIVRGELERLFSLEEMMTLTSDLLGFTPEEIGGAASKASFARALTDRCVELDATEALLDAILASRTEVDPKIRELGQKGISAAEELKPGETFGAFTIVKKLGEGPRAIVYSATKNGADRTLKVFKREATRDARAARRFVTRLRLASKVTHQNLASDLEVGIEGGRVWTSYAPVEGQPLAGRIARTGPLHINEARNLVRGVLGALAALHAKGLAHGSIKLENVIVGRGEGGTPRPVLIDLGADRLLGASFASAPLVKTTSPEVLRGKAADASSDIYSFGALLFEILTGKPVFSGETGADVAVAHLTAAPPAASGVAPRGWVNKDLDDLLAKLLSKTPSARLKDVAAVIESLEPAAKKDATKEDEQKPGISDEELNDRVDLLLADPTDGQAALSLESAIELGADANKVAEAFSIAADQIEEGESEADKFKAKEFKKAILFRAARIYESNLKDLEKAEGVYSSLLELDPDDDITFAALEELRKNLGKHEELIEMLLTRSETSESHSERARAFNEIGHIYMRDLDDKEQAAFAFAKALGQDTQNSAYAVDLERAAGSDMKLWAEALQELSQVSTQADMPAEAKIALFNRLGHWYSEKIARPDLGVPCLQAVLSVDPANDGALEALAHVYRRAQQWQELGQILVTRADRAPTPAQARDMRAEAADILETKLNEAAHARDLFEQIFAEDPGHQKATDALARIYQKAEDHEGFAKILERRADALRGEAKVEAICKLAELYEDQLNNLPEATRRYEAALELDPLALTALRGLDRIFNRTGRYKELLHNLERQINIAATPRQKIKLYERIAGIQDEEFLDHGKAAEALEAILHIDGAHEGALSALVRHYRALDRWEDVVGLYEKHLRIVTEDKRRIELLLAMGRVLMDQVGSPDRARQAYEKVLEIDPNHAGTLEALAHVRAATGDAMAALSAIESLAAKAATPDSKADLWIRAAKILEDKGDKDGAIERYKKALDAQPGNALATSQLRAAYLARGDATSAVELIARSLETAEGNLAKARLYGEMAQLLREKVRDNERAKEAATKAVDLDPTSMLGLLITGDIAFEGSRFIEAAKAYESIANRVDALPKEQGVALLIRYVDSLSKSGSTEKALGSVKSLLSLAPDNPDAISRAAKVNLDAGKAKEAATLYEDLVNRFGDRLGIDDKGEVMLRFGEARLKAGDPDGAIGPLNEAADYAPESPTPINLLCKVYEAKKDFEEVVRLKNRRLDVVSGDDRSTLLLEIGDILAGPLNDRTRAAKSYVAALDERPDDRKILTKLMQLYSEEKDWGKLVEVVMKLASKVEDKKQKAKYLHTAAIVSARQIGDLDKAIQLYDQVLELDPSLDRALAEAIEIHNDKGDHEGVERLLKVELERANEKGDNAKMLETFEKLGALYKDKLGWMSEAIDAYEAAQTVDPDNEARSELPLSSTRATRPSTSTRPSPRRCPSSAGTPTSPRRTSSSASCTPRRGQRRRGLLVPRCGPLHDEPGRARRPPDAQRPPPPRRTG